MRKFNVGDVVINFESIELWDNVYHFKNTLAYFKKEVVMAADDQCFTTAPGVDLSKRFDLDWHTERLIYSQRDGRQLGDLGAGTRFYGNWTTNEANVRAYMQKKFDEALAYVDDGDDAELKKLEAEIAFRQKQIEAIKAGKRRISYKQDIVERDFINERIAALKAIMDN